jgi:hypothetical protein
MTRAASSLPAAAMASTASARRGGAPAGDPTGLGPQQCDGLGGVADIVARQPVEHRVDVGLEQLGEDAAQRQAHEQAVGQGGQRIAAVGIGRVAEVVGKRVELAVARRRVDEAVDEPGEGLHHSSSSS